MDKNIKELKQEEVTELQEKLQETIDANTMEEMLESNTNEFEYNDKKYRIKKPTFGEKTELYKERGKRNLALLQDSGNPSEITLKKLYKQRGVDIDAMLSNAIVLGVKQADYKLKLGRALKDSKPDSELNVYKTEIEKIAIKQREIYIEKAKLLETTVETQLTIFTFAYAAYLFTEKLIGDEWVKVWNTYKELEETEDVLVNIASYYSSLLVRIDV